MKILNILFYWILWTVVLSIGIICLYGISLLDGLWPYLCMLGAVTSGFCLHLMMKDNDKSTYYDR